MPDLQIADADRKVSTLYDMLDEQDATNVDQKGIPFTVRTVFIIDPKKTIRLTLSYPVSLFYRWYLTNPNKAQQAAVGRNFDEVLRVIDALQLGDKHKIATPVNWQKGQDVIVAAPVSNEDAKRLFPDYKTVLVCPT